MLKKRPLVPVTTGVLVAALLLALVSIASVVELQKRADAGRDAQVTLAKAEAELGALQELPWDADPEKGEAAGVRLQMQASEQRIEQALAELGKRSPLAELPRAAAAFRSNLAALERLRAHVSEQRFDRAGAWNSIAEQRADVAAGAFHAAGVGYEARAEKALRQATIGSAIAILALMAAFGFFYRRSVRARSGAERLARENERLLAATREESLTDALTGLRNRRALVDDLVAQMPEAAPDAQLALALFDLDGFKEYNDAFGHPAGDSLLARLGERLATTIEGIGTAYRMGGDEFCVLARVGAEGGDGIAGLAGAALTDAGDGFEVECSYGVALIPTEAASAEDALRLADQRMYERKSSGRTSASRQSTDVLLTALSERSGELEEHTAGVAGLARRTAERLALPEREVRRIRLAAELHDVGKVAIPDAILNKPGKLDEDEWAFVRRHTLVGERIVRAAPSLADAAEPVRSSHERIDGSGYPDGLCGDEIPLGARVIAVCDAFHAMVSDRPYREAVSAADALTELRRCAGTQFDTDIVEVFCALVAELDELALNPPS